MEQLYPDSTKCEKNTVVIFDIYGKRAIFLLFRFMTEKMNLSTYQLIFTKEIYQRLYVKMISILYKMG